MESDAEYLFSTDITCIISKQLKTNQNAKDNYVRTENDGL